MSRILIFALPGAVLLASCGSFDRQNPDPARNAYPPGFEQILQNPDAALAQRDRSDPAGEDRGGDTDRGRDDRGGTDRGPADSSGEDVPEPDSGPTDTSTGGDLPVTCIDYEKDVCRCHGTSSDKCKAAQAELNDIRKGGADAAGTEARCERLKKEFKCTVVEEDAGPKIPCSQLSICLLACGRTDRGCADTCLKNAVTGDCKACISSYETCLNQNGCLSGGRVKDECAISKCGEDSKACFNDAGAGVKIYPPSADTPVPQNCEQGERCTRISGAPTGGVCIKENFDGRPTGQPQEKLGPCTREQRCKNNLLCVVTAGRREGVCLVGCSP
ncbi:MAG: hypothetical protein GMKNLPBB_00412 [Myxococcota bacterium]|nr:hypothetical protein [Myxococcota bacterium]